MREAQSGGDDRLMPRRAHHTWLGAYFHGLAVLRETRAEYWAMQVINFLDHTILFATWMLLVVFMCDDSAVGGCGMSEEHAGSVYTVFSVLTTACLCVSGLFSDWLGIRISMFINQGAMLALRLLILTAAMQREALGELSVSIVIVAICLQGPFLALGQTAFQAANRRFTTSWSRSAGFNIWYLVMNLGALTAGLIVDVTYMAFRLPAIHIFTAGAIVSGVCMVVILLFVRREEQLYSLEEGEEGQEVEDLLPGETDAQSPGQTGDEERGVRTGQAPRRLYPWQILIAALSNHVFWRFLCLMTLLLGARAVFQHLHLLMPAYWRGAIDPDVDYVTLTDINPRVVMLCLLLLLPIVHRLSVYRMLVWGAIITGLALFVLAIPAYGDFTFNLAGWSMFWNRAYLVAVIAIVVLTVGEAIWSPRLSEYAASIAPVGQEGTYLGWSIMPYFAGKFAISAVAASMLATWVPVETDDQAIQLREALEAGTIPFWQSPGAMWVILGVSAVIGPVIALACWRWFRRGAPFHHGGRLE